MGKRIEVRCGNVVVTIYRTKQVKGGKTYFNHAIVDYSSGERRLRYAANLAEAKERAKAIANGTASGQTKYLNDRDEVNDWKSDLRPEILKAMESVAPTGLSILPAAQLFAQAVKILSGRSDELLAACQQWMTQRPDGGPGSRTATVKEACVIVRKETENKSKRRQRNVVYMLDDFEGHFGGTLLHEFDYLELYRYADGRNWAPKTFNEFISTVSFVFKRAQFHKLVAKGFNPVKEIARRELPEPPIHIFEPWEARQLLNRIGADLVPFFALWLFAGIRKEEISRMTWQQVNRGIETGWIRLEAGQTKTKRGRSVPVKDNLKLWLLKHRKTSGPVLPEKWQVIERLNEITKHASRKTGIVWKTNAPRHSFGTYWFKICKDPGAVTKAMGNSLAVFDRHYSSRSDAVTEEVAKAWFAIVPAVGGVEANLVVMEKAV